MATKQIISPHVVVLFVVFLHFVAASYGNDSDAEILLRFKESLKNTEALSNWDAAKLPCNGDRENWVGILCEGGKVWGLQLENMGLDGFIDVNSLADLRDLRTVSFMNNNFQGSFPDMTRLGSLKTIYLSNNKSSGKIPQNAFNGMMSLKKLHLARNHFEGLIPSSLASLPRLMELLLDDNQFSGEIPPFAEDRIRVFNVSGNELIGEIPRSLSNFTQSSFNGNTNLCGAPLEPCSDKKPSVGTLILVGILVATAVSALIAVVIILRRRQSSPTDNPEAVFTTASQDQGKGDGVNMLERIEQGQVVSSNAASSSPGRDKKQEQSVKLTFLHEENRDRFDMTDLLKASAEVLGSGVFGSTYKAALTDGTVTVVKRYRHMNNVNREEFNEHMRRLGKLKHQNLLPVLGFYYRKEEKLLVSDYVEKGSLAVHLHGNKSRGLPSPDWPTRLRIVKGVAKALQYLYNELPSVTTPHGHLKSSNVLLDRAFNPLLVDYALIPVVNQEHAQEHMIAYKSPEYKHTNRITKKTDVWSLGILILEVLTGRFPSSFLQQGRGSDTDLTTWVESVVRDDDSNVEVFDSDMNGTKQSEGEMMKLLKIGMKCCSSEVERRPDIEWAVEKIDEVKEKDSDHEEFYSTYGSEADTRSSRGLSDDFSVVSFK